MPLFTGLKIATSEVAPTEEQWQRSGKMDQRLVFDACIGGKYYYHPDLQSKTLLRGNKCLVNCESTYCPIIEMVCDWAGAHTAYGKNPTGVWHLRNNQLDKIFGNFLY